MLRRWKLANHRVEGLNLLSPSWIPTRQHVQSTKHQGFKLVELQMRNQAVVAYVVGKCTLDTAHAPDWVFTVTIGQTGKIPGHLKEVEHGGYNNGGSGRTEKIPHLLLQFGVRPVSSKVRGAYRDLVATPFRKMGFQDLLNKADLGLALRDHVQARHLEGVPPIRFFSQISPTA
jgi:hypothetical protein